MSLPLYPIWLVDLLGSSVTIVFSFLCVVLARRIRNQDPNNVVWTYLLWLCYALLAFALSRSVGHIAKRLLLMSGFEETWQVLKPYSGAINTLTFVVVASITLFFERIWKTYQQILGDQSALQETHDELIYMNRNLEGLISARTRELALSERKYRRIFEVSRDVIMVIDDNADVVDLNPAGFELFGLGGIQLTNGKVNFADLFCNEREWVDLKQILLQQGFVANLEVLLKRHNGFPFSALLSGAGDRAEDGEGATVQFLIKDISHRKAMEKRLVQADKLASIGQLAAGIAHEINNPMSMILGYTQLLLRDEKEGTEKHSDLKIIEKHARNCKTIVSDLLSFSRSTGTRKKIGHVHSSIEEVLSVLQNHFELDGIKVEKEFDAAVPPMVLDTEKMKQVFMNLFMNAKQAIGKKGVIRVMSRFDALNSQVVIDVSDSGAGIDVEDISRIFDPFFTTKATGEGTGLGLSVSYGIVQDHGGQILVQSEPGHGATFTVVLPLNSSENEKT